MTTKPANVVGLFFATLAGSLAARIGTRTATVLGLLFIAASSDAGGYSPTAAWLVWSRLFVGIGFVMVVVAAPSLRNGATVKLSPSWTSHYTYV